MVKRPGDVLLLARVILVAALVPPLMRLRLPTLSRVVGLQGPARKPYGGRVDVERLVAFFDAARVLAYPVVRPGCLTRAITLYWFLLRDGVAVELCLGVALENGEPIGHAWLVREGSAFLEPGDPASRFTVSYRMSAVRG